MSDPRAHSAESLAQLRARVLAVRQAERMATGEEKFKLRQQLSALARDLRSHITRGAIPSGVIELSPMAAHARRVSIHDERVKLHAKYNELKQGLRQVSDKSARLRMQQDQKLIQARDAYLVKRDRMLAAGTDVDDPLTLAPHQITVPRKPLRLPPVYGVPPKTTLTTLTYMLVAHTPRRPGESLGSYRARVQSYIKRALVRYLNKKAVGQGEQEALTEATQETQVEDSPALEAESHTGGVAPDAAADVMDLLLLDGESDLTMAITELQPGTPQEITPEQVDKLLLESEELEGKVVETSQSQPLYKRPLFWLAAGILTAIVVTR